MSAPKIYVLLDHLKSTANVYQRVNKDQRVRIEMRPIDHAYGKISFTDKDGHNKIIRYVNGVDELDFHKQVKEFQIPANQKVEQSERDALRFQDGVLITTNLTVQKYLETSPQYEDNYKAGVRSPDVPRPMYRLHDPNKELETDNKMFRKRVAAANKILSLDLIQGQELMIRLNGAHFKPPATILEVQQGLVSFLDDANEAGIDDILKEDKEVSVDESLRVLLSKAINYGIISPDKSPNQIVKIKGEKVIPLKEISNEYSRDQRLQYFAEFLMTQDGKLMLGDIEKDVKAHEDKEVKKQKEKADKVTEPA